MLHKYAHDVTKRTVNRWITKNIEFSSNILLFEYTSTIIPLSYSMCGLYIYIDKYILQRNITRQKTKNQIKKIIEKVRKVVKTLFKIWIKNKTKN